MNSNFFQDRVAIVTGASKSIGHGGAILALERLVQSQAISIRNILVVFTILPGHGVMVAEKWQRGKVPFQLIWEAMDSSDLEIAAEVPQRVVIYMEDEKGRMVLMQ